MLNNNVPIKKTKKGKKKYIFLFIVGLLLTILGIYLYTKNETKSNSFVSIAADIYSSEKVYKAGKPYYKARYSYKVDGKEYKYDYPEETESYPQDVIVIKYNKKNPQEIYNNKFDLYFIGLSIVGIIISAISVIVIIAKNTALPDKNIVAVVEELVTCVGGSRIYLSDIAILPTDNRAATEKYYVLFSNNLGKYALGNQISFNANKYGEFLSTEKYKDNKIAKSLHDFKDEDLVLISVNKN